jgi:leucine dehydrogenase
MTGTGLPGLLGSDFSHELVEFFSDEDSGLRGAIALHSTTLGPAMGGVRRARYPRPDTLVDDALRLSRAMTFKNSAAGLDLGGGKAVVLDDGMWATTRRARLRALARFIDRLDGRYIAAEDVGTTPADMAAIADETKWVAGRPVELGGRGDPSPATARSVFASLLAAVEMLHGSAELAGLSVGVLGLGAVGLRLAEMLSSAGARLVVADIDETRTADAARRLQAEVVRRASLLEADVDVLAPCALGGVIGPDEVPRLQCRIVVGAANNPLTCDQVADDLHRRGVLYIPDFLAKCGGIIHVGAEVLGFSTDEVDMRIDQAVERTSDLLRRATRDQVVPLGLAKAAAMARLAPRTAVAA